MLLAHAQGLQACAHPFDQNRVLDRQTSCKCHEGQSTHSRLLALGWRVLTIWECYLKSASPEALQADLARWISGSEVSGDFNVRPTGTV